MCVLHTHCSVQGVGERSHNSLRVGGAYHLSQQTINNNNNNTVAGERYLCVASVTGISDKTMCPEAISGRRISILKIQILIIIRK
jgi:hypothetical protein